MGGHEKLTAPPGHRTGKCWDASIPTLDKTYCSIPSGESCGFQTFLAVLIGHMFPMLTAEWLHLVKYFSPECHNSRQNIINLF
jgi:hypothetical protein